MKLYFIAYKNPKNAPVVYSITNLDKPAKSIALSYAGRWKIEHCFKHLKSNGFQLEEINLKHESRCRLLMAVTIMAYLSERE
jgi:transposase